MKRDTMEQIDRYVVSRIPVGDFLHAVLSNNLMESMSRADEANRRDLFEICSYIYNHTPISCHGSPKKVKAWLSGRT